MLHAGLIAFAGLDARRVPVEIVDLDQDDVHLGMLRQDLVEKIRKYAPQAKIVIQQTWSYCNAEARICNQETKGPGTWGIDQTGMYELLLSQCSR